MKRRLQFRLPLLLLLIPPIALGAAIHRYLNSRETVLLWDRALLPYDEPSTPANFQGPMSYASRMPGVTTETVDGPSTYRLYHEAGWHECLITFVQDARYMDTPIWNATTDSICAPNSIQLPPPQLTAYSDGYFLCVDELETLLKATSEDELRRKLDLRWVTIATTSHLTAIIVGIVTWVALLAAIYRKRRRARHPSGQSLTKSIL